MKYSHPVLLWAAALVSLTGASSLFAQSSPSFDVHPNHERGLSADTAYEIGLIDNVNLFNGNLTLTLPIGQRFPVNAGFSWGLTLTYNANLWDWDQVVATCDLNGDGDTNDPGEAGPFSESEPARNTNAGLGWYLTPGELVLPNAANDPDLTTYKLLTTDGGEHFFTQKLHDSHPDDDAFYAAVGPLQFIRLTVLDQAPSATRYKIEYPDGTIHTFDDKGRCTRIEDRFGNGVDITPPPSSSGLGNWTFEDDHGRVVTIVMGSGAAGKPRIDRIKLPVFGGAPDSGSAEYVFGYQQALIPAQSDQDYCQAPNTFTVDVLMTITLPDGARYEFEYIDSSPDDLEGMLFAVNLPTRGRFEWDYSRVDYDDTGPDNPNQEYPPFLRRSFGVAEKRHYDHPGTGAGASRRLLGTWSYQYRMNTLDLFEDRPQEMRTIVVEPDGRTRYHYFSLRGQGSYGLPFTFRQEDPEGPGSGRYLSQIIIDPTRVPEPSEGVFVIPSDPLEATYLKYAFDPGPLPNENPRVEQSRTYFYDRAGATSSDPCDTPITDGGFHWVQRSNEGYDGLGNFRVQRISGNLDGEDEQTTTTAYDLMGSGAYTYVPISKPWLLGLYSELTVADEGGKANRVETCFNRTTGFLERRRVLAVDTVGSGGTVPRSGRDLITRFEPEAGTGNVAAELSYGGDGANVDLGPLCTLGNLGALGYRTEHAFSYGVRAGSEFVDPASGSSLINFLDLDIDPATSLVAFARDPAGVQASYQYDSLGRVSRISPEADAVYQFLYHAAVASSGPWAEVERKEGSTTLIHNQLYFDGLGRLVEERSRLPAAGGGHQWNRRIHRYDGLGRKVLASTTRPVGTADSGMLGTTYSYNVLGKLCLETRPDGAKTKIWTQGISLSKQRTTARGLNGGLIGQLRFYGRDAQGRLQFVQEQSSLSGTGVKTLYHYDPAGRLEEVCSPTPPPGGLGGDEEIPLAQSCGSPQQRRLFDYDGRGFLTSECHPEKYNSGSGTIGCVAYGGYDALGNPGSRDDEEEEFDLNFSYDRAGRLTQVRKGLATGSGALLKEYSYGRSNLGGNLLAGKLYQAKRHNYLPDPSTQVETDSVVTETYSYEGPEGRLSQRRTTVSDQRLDSGGAFSFDQAFSYDVLGNLESQSYPDCIHASCSGLDPAREVAYAYNDGFLVGVPGTASAISYQANGAVSQVTHASGLRDVVGLDPDWLLRPESLETLPDSSGPALWESGPFAYDEAGNIQSIGGDQYYYDKVNRLVKAEVRHAGTTYTENYGYDHFGNLLNIGQAGQVRNYPSSLQSNRITATGYTYDDAGNLIATPAGTFAFGPLGMVTTATGTGKYQHYLYTADDERIAQLDLQTQPPRLDWTLRGLDMKVLRTYSSDLAIGQQRPAWSWEQDYIYRGSSLLASVHRDAAFTEGRVEHFHLDHLGTPRLRTSASGTVLSEHKYLPYGEELTDPALNSDAMRFTGHERDVDPVGWENDLDYMHARYYSPRIGRFSSPDRAASFKPEIPQSWNRYGYVLGRPMFLTDPDGESPAIGFAWAFGRSFSGDVMQEFLKNTTRTVKNTLLGLGNGVISLGLLASAKSPHHEDFQNLTFQPETELDAREQFLGSMAAGLAVSLRLGGRASATGEGNPLEGTRYTSKIRRQMRPNVRTGETDFHGFPLEVDNFAGHGTSTRFTGGDGIVRIRVELRGSFRGKDGTFEWIIDPDGSVNHRIFRLDATE